MDYGFYYGTEMSSSARRVHSESVLIPIVCKIQALLFVASTNVSAKRLKKAFSPRRFYTDWDEVGSQTAASTGVLPCLIYHTVVHYKGEMPWPPWSPGALPRPRGTMGSMSPRHTAK